MAKMPAPVNRFETVDVPFKDRGRFCINDEQVMELARQAVTIEQHYQRPMDIEWALDGDDGKLYIVQARPETVVSQQEGGKLERFQLREKGRTLITGRAIGQRIGRGAVKIVLSPDEMDKIQEGDILVTDMTDPDWEPIMKRASAIVTNRGGVLATRRLLPVSWVSQRWWVVVMQPPSCRKGLMSPFRVPKATPGTYTKAC